MKFDYILETQEAFDYIKYSEQVHLKCTVCGKEFLRTKRNVCNAIRLNIEQCTCSKECKIQLHLKKPLNIECQNCGKIFKRRDTTRKFCSQRCAALFNNKHCTNYKKEIKCAKCGKTIQSAKQCKSKLCLHCRNKRRFQLQQKFGIDVERIKNLRVDWQCPVCNKIIKVTPSNFELRKFCSGTCRNKINNPKICGSRSKAEIKLEQKLRECFPDLTIIPNDRKILDGLELDIYIPELNIAIEWNGIYHVLPIHGEKALKKYQERDKQKKILCEQKNINLIVVEDETSHNKFIDLRTNEIIEQLKSILMRRGTANPSGSEPED